MDLFVEEPNFKRIIYATAEMDDSQVTNDTINCLKQINPEIEINEGLPVPEQLAFRTPILLILDDLDNILYKEDDFLDLMTRISHHGDISIIYTSQNFYASGSNSVTARRQLSAYVLFPNPNDKPMINTISSKLYKDARFLQEVFKTLRKRKINYVIINVHASTTLDETAAKFNTFSFKYPDSEEEKRNVIKYFFVPPNWDQL